MKDDRSSEFRHLAEECVALARRTFDPPRRAALIVMAQRWLEQAEHAEHDAWNHSFRRHAIRAALGAELKALYEPPQALPPYLLVLLAQLDQGRQKTH